MKEQKEEQCNFKRVKLGQVKNSLCLASPSGSFFKAASFLFFKYQNVTFVFSCCIIVAKSNKSNVIKSKQPDSWMDDALSRDVSVTTAHVIHTYIILNFFWSSLLRKRFNLLAFLAFSKPLNSLAIMSFFC